MVTEDLPEKMPVHEVGLVTEALNQAIDVAVKTGALRIERLNFAVADDGHVTPEAVVTLCAMLSRDTIAAGADISVRVRDATFYCRRCAAKYPGGENGPTCPRCGAVGSADGNEPELVLESVDVVDGEQA